MGRRVHLSDTGSTRSSVSALLDLTQAAATPLQFNSGRILEDIPVADMNALADLIGHATHRSHTGNASIGKKQRVQRGRSAGGSATERSGAKGSRLLPQFAKGFSLYMKRWNPTYYFGQPTSSPSPPTTASTPKLITPPSPQVKPALPTVTRQSSWAAAAEAAKSKIALIEADHARRRATAEPALVQVTAACGSGAARDALLAWGV